MTNKTNERSYSILKSLQAPSGLMMASKASVSTGYNRAWIRDNIYESLGFEAIKDKKSLVKIYQALLDVMLKHEYKIDWAIVEKPDAKHKYIHPRYDAHSLNELWEEWGNKQNDAIGALLFKVGDLESKGINIIRGKSDLRILQKLVYYLSSIQYWNDMDSGVWEENEEVHASSVGACVGGLKKISSYVDVPKILIIKGEEKLRSLLPRESVTKLIDLALLSLIYPFNVVTKQEAQSILSNVETFLVREKGVVRYIGDQYYNQDGEAEWCFGFPWLAIIYKKLNRPDKFAHYMRKTVSVMNAKGELPELYYSNSDEHNENSPLGWGQALYLVANMTE